MAKGKGVVKGEMFKTSGMSKSHMPMPQGKMSGAHGTTTKGMHKETPHASRAVGSDTRTFKNTLTQEGPKKLS